MRWPDRPKQAKACANLGLMYQHKGEPAVAEPYFKRALQLYEETLGPNHSTTGEVCVCVCVCVVVSLRPELRARRRVVKLDHPLTRHSHLCL